MLTELYQTLGIQPPPSPFDYHALSTNQVYQDDWNGRVVARVYHDKKLIECKIEDLNDDWRLYAMHNDAYCAFEYTTSSGFRRTKLITSETPPLYADAQQLAALRHAIYDAFLPAITVIAPQALDPGPRAWSRILLPR